MESLIVVLAIVGSGIAARYFYAGITAALPEAATFRLPLQLTSWSLFDVAVLMIVTTGQYYPAPARDWLVIYPALMISIPVLVFFKVGKSQAFSESAIYLAAGLVVTSIIAGGAESAPTISKFVGVATVILLIARSHQLRMVKIPAIYSAVPWWVSASAALLILAPMAGYFNENGLLSEGGAYWSSSIVTMMVVTSLVAAKCWHLKSHLLSNVPGDSTDALKLNSMLVEMATYSVLISGLIFSVINIFSANTYFLGASESQTGLIILVGLLALTIQNAPWRIACAAVVLFAACVV